MNPENQQIYEQSSSNEEFQASIPKPKRSKNATTKELLEELKASNAEMANAMAKMQEEILRLREENSKSFLEKLFHNTTKDVTQTATTCDMTMTTLAKEKEELRNNMTKTIGNLRRFQNDAISADTITAMEEVYFSCEQDINRAIQSIEEMKTCLKNDTLSASDKVKGLLSQIHNGITERTEEVVSSIKEVLTNLSNRAHLFEANCYEKLADSYRKRTNACSKARSAIYRMGSAIHEAKLGLRNAMHTIKGESTERTKYVPSGIAKKVLESLDGHITVNKLSAVLSQDIATDLKDQYGGIAPSEKDIDLEKIEKEELPQTISK